MSRVWSFIRRDARNVCRNVISLVVCVGMVVIPSFYAWFNIAGSWDPYGNTRNLKVALACSDAGYSGRLVPVRVNIGESVVSKLRASDKIGYTVTSEDDAVEGVRSGEYYAAIVIPKDFSADMMTVLSSDPHRPQVLFYGNEKENAIASIVTSKASSSVRQTIDETFADAVFEVGASTLSDLDDYLDDDQLASVARQLDGAVADSAGALRSTGAAMRGYATLVSSTRTLLGDSSRLIDTSLSSALDANLALGDAASGVRGLGGALDGATASVNDAIRTGEGGIDSVSDAIDKAFEVADGQSDKLVDSLADVKTISDERAQGLRDAAQQTRATHDALVAALDAVADQGSPLYLALKRAEQATGDLASSLESATQRADELSSGISGVMDQISQGKADATQARQELGALVGKARTDLAQVQTDYEATLKGRLSNLADSIDGAARDVSDVGGDLRQTLGSLDAAAGSADSSLAGIEDTLGDAADRLDVSAGRLDDLRARVSQALASDDVGQVRAILSADAGDLASFISSPVNVSRNAVFPVANNGSAMAPFYSTLAIWIGGVVLCALVRIAPSGEALRETGARPRHAYFGRLAFFLVIGLMQSSLVLLGDLFFLRIQCVHPWLFLLAGWFASIVFVNIVYALTASFGDVGKAIAVVLMVIQVAGSGGTFPLQMLPPFFQVLYPFLPFVHAESALRAAIAGLWGADFWLSMGALALFLVPSLLLGLVLRKPVVRMNEWVERNLERTSFM